MFRNPVMSGNPFKTENEPVKKEIKNNLPNKLEIKGGTFGQEGITAAAKEFISVEGVTSDGPISIIAGVPSQVEAEVMQTLSNKTAEIIKKNIFPKYPHSTKLTLFLGKNSYCETFTADPDGFTRDDKGN